MGTVTIVLSDDLEKELRRIVKELYGSEKGHISKFIEDAIRNYMHSLEKREFVYRAYKKEELVAEAGTLEDLVKVLKEKKIDVRGLRIIRSDLKKTARAGYRLRV